MDRKIIWTDEAISDLESIAAYISKDSPYYAKSFIEEILKAGRSLSYFPERGRIVPEFDHKTIRELFINEYRLIYKIEDNLTTILGVIHGRRDLIREF